MILLPISTLLALGATPVASSPRHVADTGRDSVGVAVIVEYLSYRQIVTRQMPTVVLCGTLGAWASEEVARIVAERTERMKTSRRVIHRKECRDAGGEVAMSDRPTIQLVQMNDKERSRITLTGITNSDNGYYFREQFTYNAASGTVVSLLFTGFEEYYWNPKRPS